MEDGCLPVGYPDASTVNSLPLDSITLPWLAIPATQPIEPSRSNLQAPATLSYQWRQEGEQKDVDK